MSRKNHRQGAESGDEQKKKRPPKRKRQIDSDLDGIFEMNPANARHQSINPPMGTPRYRDPENPFNTWSGNGRPPKWFRERVDNGTAPEQMEIKHHGQDTEQGD